MEIACDMHRPVGYWVQQVRGNGETIAVKVLHDAPHSQADVATTRDPTHEATEKLKA